MIAFLREYFILIGVFFAIVWFVFKYIVADLPDDVLSVVYKRLVDKKKEAEDGRLRDHR